VRPPPERPPEAGIVVDISDRQRLVRVGHAWLERLVRKVLEIEGVRQAEIGLSLVGDRGIARVHAEWLGLPGPTDVITFDLGDGDLLRGDLVVSAETARRMSREFAVPGWTPRLETGYYVVHGLLHLCGYDDLRPADRRAMRRREQALLRRLGMPPAPRGGIRREAS